LIGLDGDDTIDGGTVLSPGSSDTLEGGNGNDHLSAGRYAYSNDELYGGEGHDTLKVNAGSNALYGGGGDDHLTAGSGGMYHGPTDYLDGGAGNDTLQGGGGLSGGDGNDSIATDNNTGHASGGLGDDTISGTGGSGYSNLSVYGDGGNDAIAGYALNNHLFADGGEGNDTIDGGAVQDVKIDGGIGDDILTGYRQTGGSGEVLLLGGDGHDVVSGANHNGTCTVSGGEGNDVLSGSTAQGSVALNGDAGHDTLSAGHGMAALTGGEGDDLFILSAKAVFGTDEVWTTDFTAGSDQLAISQGALAVGNGDLVVDGAVVVPDGAHGFETSAELVIIAADIFGELTPESAAAAIGQANQDYEAGQTVLFMVDNGVDSMALHFTSSGVDGAVTADELSIVGTLVSTVSTAAEDVVWSA
jgi:Ca2+-binding RTX toxin-like protein